MKHWLALLLLAAGLACAFRLPQLDRRPMHNDEAVNAIKFGALWQHGEYQYDPREYHGPALHYLTAVVCRLTGSPDFQHLSEVRLRLVTALAGVALVLSLMLIRDSLGRNAVVAGAFFTALSPVMVFYSRYWIHELLLVLFCFLGIAAAWKSLRKPSWKWAAISGLSLGFAQATKETFVFAVAAAGGSLLLGWLWQKSRARDVAGSRLPRKQVGMGVGVWLIAWACLFSSFFTDSAGLLNSVRTYGFWLGHAGGESVHAHEWSFFFERLLWFHRQGGPVWSEGFLLFLAIVGGWNAFRRVPAGDGDAAFVRFLAGYTVLLAAIYSVIPYKTPWCVLGFWHGIILLAGVGAVVLWRTCDGVGVRVALVALLGLGMGHLGWQAWRASFELCADQRTPWTYAQTSPDLLNLVQKVKAVSAAGQGEATTVKVFAAEGDYWPLPWYLRAFSNIGWWDNVTGDTSAPLVIASRGMKLPLDERGTHVMVGNFQLRPRVFLELYVERGLWERYLARRPGSGL